MFVVEKTFKRIWRELGKKRWTCKKSTGLSNAQRYIPRSGNVNGVEGTDYFVGETSLLRYCRRQGWLEFPLPAARSTTAVLDTATVVSAAATITTAVTTVSATTTASTASATATTSTANTVDTATTATTAAPATTSASGTSTKRKPATTEPSRTTKRKRRSEPTVSDVLEAIPERPEHPVPDPANAVTDYPDQPVTEIPIAHTRVPVDDFDSENFIAALKRDRLSDPLSADDMNIGEGDWRLRLDSETEGDEDTILFDEDTDDDVNGSEGPSDDSDASDNDDFQLPAPSQPVPASAETPVVFDRHEEQLDRLQQQKWETYDEHCSGTVLVDPAQLYNGESGPSRAALAYAENPLAIYYFFLPKKLWRKIDAESNTCREARINEVADRMRERAREQREVKLSTVVLAVEECKSKLRRKPPFQPHEPVRFIGLLIARTLEPRRESLSRH